MEGQYVAYTFYRVDPAWRRLPVEERRAGKDAFAEVVEEWASRFDALRAYTVTGVRPDCDFFLWKITERYPDLGELAAALNATPQASQYTRARRARRVVPRGSPYLVVYPFVKVRAWYALPAEERQRAMDEHMRIGAEFETIHNHTTYSFGIDDQEFMTVFECEEPADFMHLMLTLRESEASRYTERDTPIFVGEAVTIREALDRLDGASPVEGDDRDREPLLGREALRHSGGRVDDAALPAPPPDREHRPAERGDDDQRHERDPRERVGVGRDVDDPEHEARRREPEVREDQRRPDPVSALPPARDPALAQPD